MHKKTVEIIVKDGPGLTGSLVVTLQTIEQVLGKQIIESRDITMLL